MFVIGAETPGAVTPRCAFAAGPEEASRTAAAVPSRNERFKMWRMRVSKFNEARGFSGLQRQHTNSSNQYQYWQPATSN
jgi:hypothetical protein